MLKPGPSQEGRQFKEARIEGKSAEGSGQGKEEAGKKKVVEGREVVEEAVREFGGRPSPAERLEDCPTEFQWNQMELGRDVR